MKNFDVVLTILFLYWLLSKDIGILLSEPKGNRASLYFCSDLFGRFLNPPHRIKFSGLSVSSDAHNASSILLDIFPSYRKSVSAGYLCWKLKIIGGFPSLPNGEYRIELFDATGAPIALSELHPPLLNIYRFPEKPARVPILPYKFSPPLKFPDYEEFDQAVETGELLLDGIRYSNVTPCWWEDRGAVYCAHDIENDIPVIVKHAKPNISLSYAIEKYSVQVHILRSFGRLLQNVDSKFVIVERRYKAETISQRFMKLKEYRFADYVYYRDIALETVRKFNSLGLKHGDPHMMNILMDENNRTIIIDFDMASVSNGVDEEDETIRHFEDAWWVHAPPPPVFRVGGMEFVRTGPKIVEYPEILRYEAKSVKTNEQVFVWKKFYLKQIWCEPKASDLVDLSWISRIPVLQQFYRVLQVFGQLAASDLRRAVLVQTVQNGESLLDFMAKTADIESVIRIWRQAISECHDKKIFTDSIHARNMILGPDGKGHMLVTQRFLYLPDYFSAWNVDEILKNEWESSEELLAACIMSFRQGSDWRKKCSTRLKINTMISSNSSILKCRMVKPHFDYPEEDRPLNIKENFDETDFL